jgi:hypothetical protein
MTSLLGGIVASAFLSVSSLIIVLLRVSPLTSPEYALPAFFSSIFLSVSSVGSLAFLGIWKMLPFHTWDFGKILSTSVREGILLGLTIILLLLFHILGLLTWWVGLLIGIIFLAIELSLHV